MGKYEPLARYLRSRADDSWNATFMQIEEKLGFPLPRSAREHRAWWSNQKEGHSQAVGWQSAGWETREVDLSHGRVRFERARAQPTPIRRGGRALWEEAEELSGIKDREQLIEAALTALIRQETTRYFAEIGGTMPDFEPGPRERPFA